MRIAEDGGLSAQRKQSSGDREGCTFTELEGPLVRGLGSWVGTFGVRETARRAATGEPYFWEYSRIWPDLGQGAVLWADKATVCGGRARCGPSKDVARKLRFPHLN